MAGSSKREKKKIGKKYLTTLKHFLKLSESKSKKLGKSWSQVYTVESK